MKAVKLPQKDIQAYLKKCRDEYKREHPCLKRKRIDWLPIVLEEGWLPVVSEYYATYQSLIVGQAIVVLFISIAVLIATLQYVKDDRVFSSETIVVWVCVFAFLCVTLGALTILRMVWKRKYKRILKQYRFLT